MKMAGTPNQVPGERWLSVGSYIDSKDTTGNWCVSKVIKHDLEQGKLVIRYDGWSSKWDMDVHKTSSKIAPFRTYSQLYTGQRKIAIRDWSFSIEELDETEARLRDMLKSDLKCEDAYCTTQFIRGHVFTLIDCLLVNTFKNKAEMHKSVEFFGTVIEFIVEWMKKAKELLPKYYEALTNSELFKSDNDTALACAWPELLFTLKRLFGLDERTCKFFKSNSYATKTYQASDLTYYKTSSSNSLTLLYLINLFAKLGGFECILKLLEEDDDMRKIPLNFLEELPIYDVYRFLSNEYAAQFVPSFRTLVMARINNISNRELKDLDKDIVNSVLFQLKKIVTDHDRNLNGYEIIERAELDFSLKLLTCPYLEKRLKGLNEIREIIDRCSNKAVNYQKIPRSIKWLKSEMLVEWLRQNRVIELILGELSHVEMVKRVGTLLIFLAKYNSLTDEHLELLWGCTQGKHDSMIIATYSTIVEIAPFINKPHHDFLFERMRAVPANYYDEQFLKMLKDFSTKAIEASYRYCNFHTAKQSEWYGMPIFYSLMLDSSSVDYCELATDYLGEMLKSLACRDQLWPLLEQAMDNVEAGHSVPQLLKLSITILDNFSLLRSSSKEEQIKKLNERVNGLVNLILKNTEKYIESARQVAGNFDSPYRSVLVGHYSHRTNIKRRLQFLEYLISAGKVITLSKEDIGRLWNIFIINPLTHRDSEMFFKWLQKTLASKNFISPALMHSIFEDFLCNAEEFPPEKIRQNGFTCFHKFFLQLNYSEKKLEIRGNLVQRNHPELIGESYLFTIMTVVEDNNVYTQVANLLVSLYLKLTKSLAERKVDLWNSFINTILEIISKSLSSPFIIYRCLNLLQSFLEETDATTSKEENSSQTVFYVKQVNETENNRLHVPYYSNIGMLRKKIAEFYKKPKYSVVIHTGGVKYDSNDDELPLSNLRSSMVIAEFIASKNGEVSPKIIMYRHQALNDTLYQLLGDYNQPYISTACKLILSLPFNERLKAELKDLNEPIENLLESGSIYRLLYCLMIIDGLVKDEEWLERFTQVRGPQHLVKVFLETDISASGFSARYSAMVVKILEILLTRVTVDVSPKKIVRKVLDSILQVCEAWTQPCELNQEEAADIPKNADRLLMRFMELHTDQSRSAMSKYSKLDQLLTNGLILCHNTYLSTSMVNLLLKQCDKSKRLRHGILRMLLSLMDAAIQAGSTSEGYWVLTTHLLSEDDDNEDICIQTARKIVQLLYDREPEKSSKDQDKVMVGMLKILNVFLQKRLLEVSEELIELVLHKCLFEVPSEEKHSNLPPKCKSSDSRREAFQLLHKMCGSNRQALLNVLKYLCKFHEDPSWRTGKSSDWNYSPNALEKSETGYVGMKNLGCTCYMNSILQQLFMIPSFREGILRATLDQAETPDDNLLLQLQYIFSALKESDKQYINPKAFTQSFKDWEGKPINVLEQMDVDEFFNTFMDRLENLIKGHQNEHIIKNHFGGLQATELIGKGNCSHRSERDEPFLALPVQVKNKKSLIESLESFVEGELLEGDNAYQCDHCEAKVPAVRRVCIKHLPNILIIVLRRFEFNYDTMTRLKVNDYCEFPTEIDMEPFTQEGLERKDLLKKKEKAMQEGTEFDKEIPEVRFPEDYYSYKLKGVVIHMGTAESGHYYSFIQDRDKEQWYEFNDTLVRPFDPEDLPSEAYGGEERWSSNTYSSTTYSTGSRSALVEKYRNAYLLFYERKGVYGPRNTDEDTISSMRLDDIVGEYTKFKQVKEENERYWRCRSSFSPEYIEFVLDLARSHDETEVIKFVCAFVMTTLLRSKDAQKFPGFITILKSKLKTSPEVSSWLLETVSVEPVLKELLLDCPINERRKIIVGLLCHAIFAVDFECQKSFLGRVLNKLPLAKKPHSKNFAQYFELLYRVVKLYRTLLSENSIISRLFSYLIESPDEYPPCPENYIHSDIYLGYDHYTPTEESVSDRFTSSENSSIAYLLLTLEHGFDYLKPDQKLHLSSKNMLSKLSVEGLNKVSAKAVGKLFAKMSRDNSKVSGDCIMIITQGINDNDYDYHKIFMRELTWLLKMDDSIQAERVEYAMRNLLKVMKENNRYYKATETCIDYIFRFAMKFSIIKDWIAKRNSEFKWLDQWLRDNQYPPSTYTQTRSNVVMYKGKNAGWTSKTPVRSNADRLDFLRKLMKGQIQPRREEWDSDEDLPDECRDIGSKVDIVDPTGQRWTRAAVINNLGDLILVKYEGFTEKSNRWIDINSEYIAPEGIRAYKTSNH